MKRARVAAGVFAMTCITVWLLLRDDRQKGLQTSTASEAPVESLEDWVAESSRAGSGVIRQPIADRNGQPTGQVKEVKYESAGPLSKAGKRQLRTFIDTFIANLESDVEQLGAGGMSPKQELALLVKYEEWLIVREQLEAGNYMTIPEGNGAPATPKNHQDFLFTPHPLESGGSGQVFFVVDRNRHKALRDAYRQYSDLAEDDKRKAIRDFNSKPLEERREWLRAYVNLRNTIKEKGQASLNAEQVTEWWSRVRMLNSLEADVSESNAVLVPRLSPPTKH